MRRPVRILVLNVAMAALALGGAGSPAQAATLYTTPVHTTRVTVGATASLTSGSLVWTSGTATINLCQSATLSLTLDQNTTAAVTGTVTAAAYSGCTPFAITGTFTTPWKLSVSGTSIMSGTDTDFLTTTLANVAIDEAGGLDTGTYSSATGTPPTNGIYASQPTTAGAPLCLVLDRAGNLTGPLSSQFKLSGRFCLEGTAASTWSLT